MRRAPAHALLLLLLACTAPLPLARAPYVQAVTPEAATIAFRLEAPCATAQVRYGEGEPLEQAAASEATGTTHAVRLQGLRPATTYRYTVEACSTVYGPRRFTTAPVPGTPRVHFAAVGDFGTGGGAQRDVTRAMLAARPELLLTLGDNAYAEGSEEEVQRHLFLPMADLLAEVPLFGSLGNHEYVTDQGQPYLDALHLPTSVPGGERYYSFDWGHVHFVALDSSCAIGLASPERCSLAEQRAWVEQDLAASQAAWKVVFFHHPPWSSGKHTSHLTMRREFVPLFEKHGVDLVLTGHDHNYERTRPMWGDAVAPAGVRGITYVVVGSGGASLRGWNSSQPAWSLVRDNDAHGYLDVRVEGGTLTARLLTPEGRAVDTFTLRKVLPAP
jgi:acid phosphatase type 7